MSKKIILASLIFVFMFCFSAYAVDITGTWQGNDGGQYYIRQLGNTIWWYGENSPNSPSWSNVSHGSISGNMLNLQWADVPKGRMMNSGTLLLELINEGKIVAKQKTGGFGGSEWTKKGYIPPQQPQTKGFNNPMYKGHRVDICLNWGTGCEKPAADRFCKEMGFRQAKSWKVAWDIGHITPTIVIGDNKICNQQYCDGFSFIECQ
ncbi:MAG: hypothetical protein LLF28_03045 [Nitrospiraceae bacterium]|nr:hypothetical protein [Nitrospiraceae bacterium]